MWPAHLTATPDRRKPEPPANPRPRGHIEPAGATAQLLHALGAQPQRFWSYREIHVAMAERKSLNWSLRYARQMGWIQTAADPRCGRYQRYRITALGLQFFVREPHE